MVQQKLVADLNRDRLDGSGESEESDKSESGESVKEPAKPSGPSAKRNASVPLRRASQEQASKRDKRQAADRLVRPTLQKPKRRKRAAGFVLEKEDIHQSVDERHNIQARRATSC